MEPLKERGGPDEPTRVVWQGPLDGTEEGRRLLADPAFRQALDAGRASGPGLELGESNRRAGITPEEWAAADAEIDRLLAAQAALDTAAADRRERRGIPGPAPRGETGRLMVRLPKKLHRELVAQAGREGVSLNTLIVSYLAREAGVHA